MKPTIGTKALTLLLVLSMLLSFGLCGCKSREEKKYEEATALLEQGKYDEAARAFQGVWSYKDAKTMISECRYRKALALAESGKSFEAQWIFEDLGDYADCAQRVAKLRYKDAVSLFNEGMYEDALELFSMMEDYADAAERVTECYYKIGCEYMNLSDYLTAYDYFLLAGDFKDAVAKLDEALYCRGNQLFVEGRTAEAQTYWDRVQTVPANAIPHFDTLLDAREYLQEQGEQLSKDIICLIGTMPEYGNQDELLHLVSNYIPYRASGTYYFEMNKELTIHPTYYSGQRIIYAWRTGEESILTAREQEAMNFALDLVAQAKASSDDPIAVEWWLYQWLCENVVYDYENSHLSDEEFLSRDQSTCVGALLDRYAICQGYADAFYTLGTMAGLDVCMMGGKLVGGRGHAWNGVMLDGKLYMVDATNGAAMESNIVRQSNYFNMPYRPEKYSIYGGPEMFPELVTEND